VRQPIRLAEVQELVKVISHVSDQASNGWCPKLICAAKAHVIFDKKCDDFGGVIGNFESPESGTGDFCTLMIVSIKVNFAGVGFGPSLGLSDVMKHCSQ
jgi:hypothetical protein